MPNLARTNPKQPARSNVPAAKTKILLVRQPVKSVRKSDEPDRAMLQLAYGVVIVLGIIAAVWLMGYLGFRLGFAPAVRVPDLMAEGAGGLAAGAMMLMSLPRTIVEAGIAEPMLLMLGFAMIAVPAGILGAIKPSAPGGPKPKTEIVALSIIGAIAAALNAGAVVAWAVSPWRAGWIGELPFAPDESSQWVSNLQVAGGLDALGAVAAALWVVVVMRLAIPGWLRVLAASACFFGLAIISVAMAMSNVTVSQITTKRPVGFLDDGAINTQLALGHTPRSVAVVRVDQRTVVVELRDRPAILTIVGQESLEGFLMRSAPKPE